MVDCISEYTNDQVSVNPQNPNVESTGLYMYDKLLDEGNIEKLTFLKFLKIQTP